MSKKNRGRNYPARKPDGKPPEEALRREPGGERNLVAFGEHFQGPIPPPELLKRYDDVHPGLANRIIEMAERESSHRQELERQITDAQMDDVKSARKEARRGQWFALVIVLGAFAAAVFVAVAAPPNVAMWVAPVIVGTTLVSVVIAFLTGRSAGATEGEPRETRQSAPNGQ